MTDKIIFDKVRRRNHIKIIEARWDMLIRRLNEQHKQESKLSKDEGTIIEDITDVTTPVAETYILSHENISSELMVAQVMYSKLLKRLSMTDDGTSLYKITPTSTVSDVMNHLDKYAIKSMHTDYSHKHISSIVSNWLHEYSYTNVNDVTPYDNTVV